jgi:hypothetical protein
MYCRYLVINELIFFSLHSIIVNFFLAMETLKEENKIFLPKNIYYKCCFLVGYFFLRYGNGIGWIFEVFVKKSKFSLCNKAATRAETKKTPQYGPLPPPPGTGSAETQQYSSCPHLSSCSNPRRHAIIQQEV